MGPSNYDEPFRGQFHFSPLSGWMNDVNGLWYSGGLYHMAYQHFPYGLNAGPMTWGHATSPDLLHWTQEPIMISAEQGFAGHCWSGSAVVDIKNSAGFQTGAEPPIVVAYTATSKGTCLAYSNDTGRSFHPYEGNPVAVGGPNADTRDPHLLWHAESAQWVCVLFENGMTFYTSPDLKHWTKGGNVPFGNECPDMYPLPLDGDPQRMRWVLQDAAGSYLVGDFDGLNFHASQAVQKMDQGPQFYAAQTFFRDNLPKQRVVQIGWNGYWSGDPGPQTHPWKGYATFPVELGLRTFPEGVRITRNPIPEIAAIEKPLANFRGELKKGDNLLKDVKSETCDLEFTLDLGRSSASEVYLHFGRLLLTYHVSRQQLDGDPLPLRGGKLHLRILRDWGQLEIFGGAGEFSASRTFPFTPGDGGLGLSADGSLWIDQAEVRSVARCWRGKARKPAITLDNCGPETSYGGDWAVDPSDFYFAKGCHYSRSSDAFVKAPFKGTSVEWWGLVNDDLGVADIYVDEKLVRSVDCYSPQRSLRQLFAIEGLRPGKHLIRVAVSGRKNPSSKGIALVHDYFTIRG